MHGFVNYQIIGTFKGKAAAKKAERDHVLLLRSEGCVVAGAGWSSSEFAEKAADNDDWEFLSLHYADEE